MSPIGRPLNVLPTIGSWNGPTVESFKKSEPSTQRSRLAISRVKDPSTFRAVRGRARSARNGRSTSALMKKPSGWLKALQSFVMRARANPELKNCKKAMDAVVDGMSWLSAETKQRYKAHYADDTKGSLVRASAQNLRSEIDQRIQSAESENAKAATEKRDAQKEERELSRALSENPRKTGLSHRISELKLKRARASMAVRHRMSEINLLKQDRQMLDLVEKGSALLQVSAQVLAHNAQRV